jgi:hypothetical protein
MNKKNIIIYFLILFIIVLLIIFYLFDMKNIKVQQYLNNIYNNSKFFNNKYSSLINKDYKIIKENYIIIINDFLNPDYHYFLNSKTHDLLVVYL